MSVNPYQTRILVRLRYARHRADGNAVVPANRQHKLAQPCMVGNPLRDGFAHCAYGNSAAVGKGRGNGALPRGPRENTHTHKRSRPPTRVTNLSTRITVSSDAQY